MRVAFVGKGGAGKTTLTALYTSYLASLHCPVLLIDADINMHALDLLDLEVSTTKHLSHPQVREELLRHIKSTNPRLATLGHIKKTTPPTSASGFFSLAQVDNPLYAQYCARKGSIHAAVVGTYEPEHIGKSCYHNNLSTLEVLLSHTLDHDTTIVCDMVAGVDAFAGSLHAQFDLLVLSVEPTKRSIAVYEHYADLAKHAGVLDQLYVVGNKIDTHDDALFIQNHVPKEKYLGSLLTSTHLRAVDKGQTSLTIASLEEESIATLAQLHETLRHSQRTYNDRLAHIQKLHRLYVQQSHVLDRFGDLTGQIEEDFDLDAFAQDYDA